MRVRSHLITTKRSCLETLDTSESKVTNTKNKLYENESTRTNCLHVVDIINGNHNQRQSKVDVGFAIKRFGIA